MKFEEQFPSLEGSLGVIETVCSNCEHTIMTGSYTHKLVLGSKVQEHCLDKQKVRDAIENCRGWEDDRNLEQLKKELNLI